MNKILYVPLDERPCNYEFPGLLAAGTDFTVVRPDLEIMGMKKRPGNIEELWNWLFEQAADADGAILSLDALLYGGIIPSRLHDLTIEDCNQLLQRLQQLKQINPKITLFAFNLIMRCPRYSSSDEEPDYYEDWGEQIFNKGYIEHRMRLGIATEEEEHDLQRIYTQLPESYWNDYVERRAVNGAVNVMAIQLVQNGLIDFMIIPQDDSAPFGLTAVDQQKVREAITEAGVQHRVFMYPGADEVGSTLLARMMNQKLGKKPLVYARFSSAEGPFITPLYEDRLLYESLKYQIIAAGGLLCSSFAEADFILCVNTPGGTMMEASLQKSANAGYHMSRNILELTEVAEYTVNILSKPCVIGDIAFANGSDLELLHLLREKKLLFRLAGYAGWNTSSNTLGTCIAQGMIYCIYGDSQHHRDFLALRFVEDAGYCGYVRRLVCDQYLPHMRLNYFAVDGQRGEVARIVKAELNRFIEDYIHYDNNKIIIDDCYMPWNRMFEVGLKTHVMQQE